MGMPASSLNGVRMVPMGLYRTVFILFLADAEPNKPDNPATVERYPQPCKIPAVRGFPCARFLRAHHRGAPLSTDVVPSPPDLAGRSLSRRERCRCRSAMSPSLPMSIM